MSKELKKRLPKNFGLIVLEEIKKGKNPASIAISFGISEQRINYYISRLKRQNLIEKIGYGVWEAKTTKKPYPLPSGGTVATTKKASIQNVDIGEVVDIRGHAFRFPVKIPKLERWADREKFLKKNNILFKHIPQGQRITVYLEKVPFNVWLCSSSLVIIFPKGEIKSYYAKSAVEGFEMGLYDLRRILTKLENLFKTTLKINKEWSIDCSRREFAHLRNALAKEYNDEKKKLYIFDKFGHLRLLADASLAVNEFEAVDPKKSMSDMDNVVKPFFVELLSHYDETGETLSLTGMKDILGQVVKNQLFHEENIKSHVKSIQTNTETTIILADNVKKMALILERFEKRL